MASLSSPSMKRIFTPRMPVGRTVPGSRMQMVSSVINPQGAARKGFARTDEYIFFVSLGEAQPVSLSLSNDWLGKIKEY